MFTFATTVPATPLNNAYHGGTSLFYNSMRYTKQPIGIPAQLAIMKQRGLVVNDETLAMKQLASINPSMPQLPQRLPLAWVETQYVRPMKLYAQLCTLLYLEQSITPNSQIKNRLLVLFAKYPTISLKQMGFPRDWKSQPLWQ